MTHLLGSQNRTFFFFPFLLRFTLTFTILLAKIGIIFHIFPENRFRHFMQIVSIGDNLHEMSKPVF